MCVNRQISTCSMKSALCALPEKVLVGCTTAEMSSRSISWCSAKEVMLHHLTMKLKNGHSKKDVLKRSVPWQCSKSQIFAVLTPVSYLRIPCPQQLHLHEYWFCHFWPLHVGSVFQCARRRNLRSHFHLLRRQHQVQSGETDCCRSLNLQKSKE